MNAIFNMLNHAGCKNMAHWPLRLAMAGIFLYHGPPKLMDQSMAAMMNVPDWMWMIVGAVEVAAGLGFILGGILKGDNSDKITRLSGLALVPVMLGAIFMVHWPKWNFMENGMEFQVLILAVALYTAFTGLKSAKD